MFKKVLIANRAEFALRVMYACRELGLRTVAVYTIEEENSPHVCYADDAICIGKGSIEENYTNIANIIAAAKISGCDAIHPGCGFLAENVEFVDACENNGIAFIGPKSRIIELMTDHEKACESVRLCGIPVIPRSKKNITSLEDAKNSANNLGYPILFKVNVGQFGKPIDKVYKPSELEEKYNNASKVDKKLYGSNNFYMEKLIESPRHIKVHVVADRHGNRSTLCERDCTIALNGQNLLEESPACILPKELRRQMMVSALKLIRIIDYENLGTVEFLFGRDGKFYFLKMATSLQADYAITEEITGVDLIKEQICVAAGEKLSYTSNAIRFPKSHAMEFHIKALDPYDDFKPCKGRLNQFVLPSGFGLRIDTEYKKGDKVSASFPTTLAKIVVNATDRQECLTRAKRVLRDFHIQGVQNTKNYILTILDKPSFIDMGYGKDFINKEMSNFSKENHG